MPAARRPNRPTVPTDLDPADAGSGLLEDEATLEAVALGGTAPDGLDARLVTIAAARLTASLAGAALPEVHLRDCEIAGGDWANARLGGAALHRVHLREARLTGVTLTEASLRDATFDGCRMNLAALAGARLERVVFSGCDLRETSFDEAQLRDVRFERCELAGASLHRSRLQRVELVGCDLARVRSVADLRGATMPWADVIANAGPLAVAAGIAILDDDDSDPRR